MNPRGPHSPPSPSTPIWRVDAAAIVDADHTRFAPGAILLERSPSRTPLPIRDRSVPVGPIRVLAVGHPQDIDAHPANASPSISRDHFPNHILLPGLINAHTHLDLTHVGPQPFNPAAGFAGWVDMIRAARASNPAEIEQSVSHGIALSLQGGVVAVGDIAGAAFGRPQITPAQTLADSPLGGVCFLEFFAIGRPEAPSRQLLAELLLGYPHSPSGDSFFPLGLQPHATNTVSSASFLWAIEQAVKHDLPLMTHAAESPEERAFIADCSGPQRALLERLGIWTDAIATDLGKGCTPIAHLAPALAAANAHGRPFALAHCNDASDADLSILKQTNATVCYCPRASDYFQAHDHFGPHRYRDMLAAGIPVALGTDSIVNLPESAAAIDGPGISTLDEMRFLYRRDHTDPFTLLRMATLHAARALAMDPAGFTFAPSSHLRGLLAVPLPAPASNPNTLFPDAALRAALVAATNPQLLCMGNSSCQTVI